ncbi:MAG: type 1 glutamine amidotransferase [Geminicoccaceae bacterium]
MRIGILQAGHVPPELADRYEDYGSMIRRMVERGGRDFRYECWSVVDDVFPDDVRACDAWVISGSRFGAYDDHPWIRRLEDFVRESFAASIPMVGICFGHQIMAKALGGRVAKADVGWGVGAHEHGLVEAPAWHDGNSIRLNVMHQDQVLEAPPESRVIASSEFCPVAALAFGDNGLSFQGHPEFVNAYERELIAVRRGGPVPADIADRALGDLPQGELARDADTLSRWIADFLFETVSSRQAPAAPT